MENKLYAYWLCNTPKVGNRTIEKLQKHLGDPERIYYASEKEWAQILKPAQLEEMKKHRLNWKLRDEYNKLLDKGIAFLLKEDKDYPRRLLNIPDAPYGIFLKGHLPDEDKMSVAIIGARDCSEYGRYVAEALGKYLGENGVQVISGMARGIDSISQEAALKAGGTSYAVLGCGVDVCYPAQNRVLYERIQKQGGILSIYPPGTAPKSQNFPPRNRIVSGLADVIVVVEARQKSGTLITVDMALEQGKEVYVVPGRVTDRLSDGCNSLLKQGAGILLSPETFLLEIKELWQKQKCERGNIKQEKRKHVTQKTQQKKEKKTENEDENRKNVLSSELQVIYEVLDFYPQSMESLLTKLPGQYTIVSLNTALMRLCLEDYALQVSPGHFCRRKPE